MVESAQRHSTDINKALRNNRKQIYRPSAKQYLAGVPNSQSTSQMLPIFYKHFAMIKEKLDNKYTEQSSQKLKKAIVLSHHVLHDCTDEKLNARDECEKVVVAGLGKLSKLIGSIMVKDYLFKRKLERNSSLRE